MGVQWGSSWGGADVEGQRNRTPRSSRLQHDDWHALGHTRWIFDVRQSAHAVDQRPRPAASGRYVGCRGSHDHGLLVFEPNRIRSDGGEAAADILPRKRHPDEPELVVCSRRAGDAGLQQWIARCSPAEVLWLGRYCRLRKHAVCPKCNLTP